MGAIEVVGGPLNQYDKDRRVLVDDAHEGDYVDFGRTSSDTAVRMEIDGEGWSKIPNQLLTQSGVLYFWLYRGGQTVAFGRKTVNPRPMPPDYYFEETPTVGYVQLSKRVDELEQMIEAIGTIEYATDEDIEGLYSERKD